MNDIKELLEKHQYIVLFKLMENGCAVYYPERKQHPIEDARVLQYELSVPNASCVKVSSIVNASVTGSVILVGPRYAHKSLITFHTIKRCIAIHFEMRLINFVIVGEPVEECDFFEALTYTDLTEEEGEKERSLHELLIPAYQSGFSDKFLRMAEEADVAEGYLAVKELMNL